MKNIGFICEGESDAIIINSDAFQTTLQKLNLKCVRVIEAEGNGNLLPGNIQEHIQTLFKEKAEVIIILTDLDENKCITETKKRIAGGNLLPPKLFTLIAVKALESWFLADSETLSSIFRKKYFYPLPEKMVERPFEKLNEEFKVNYGRGTGGSKTKFARWILTQGFTIEGAANHGVCPSAKYFLTKLQEISTS